MKKRQISFVLFFAWTSWCVCSEEYNQCRVGVFSVDSRGRMHVEGAEDAHYSFLAAHTAWMHGGPAIQVRDCGRAMGGGARGVIAQPDDDEDVEIAGVPDGTTFPRESDDFDEEPVLPQSMFGMARYIAAQAAVVDVEETPEMPLVRESRSISPMHDEVMVADDTPYRHIIRVEILEQKYRTELEQLRLKTRRESYVTSVGQRDFYGVIHREKAQEAFKKERVAIDEKYETLRLDVCAAVSAKQVDQELDRRDRIEERRDWRAPVSPKRTPDLSVFESLGKKRPVRISGRAAPVVDMSWRMSVGVKSIIDDIQSQVRVGIQQELSNIDHEIFDEHVGGSCIMPAEVYKRLLEIHKDLTRSDIQLQFARAYADNHDIKAQDALQHVQDYYNRLAQKYNHMVHGLEGCECLPKIKK